MATTQSPYQILGEDGIRALVTAFYDIMEQEPELSGLRHMHADNLAPMRDRLADYLIGWMGGPPRYREKYGTVCLTEPHQDFHIGPVERDLWLDCFWRAMDAVDASDELRQMLEGPIFQVADAVRNRESSDSPLDNPDIIATSIRRRS